MRKENQWKFLLGGLQKTKYLKKFEMLNILCVKINFAVFFCLYSEFIGCVRYFFLMRELGKTNRVLKIRDAGYFRPVSY